MPRVVVAQLAFVSELNCRQLTPKDMNVFLGERVGDRRGRRPGPVWNFEAWDLDFLGGTWGQGCRREAE